MTDQLDLFISRPKPGLYWARVPHRYTYVGGPKTELVIVRFNDEGGDQWFDVLREVDGDVFHLHDDVQLLEPIGEPYEKT